jgi:hypothetical protein
MTQHGLNLEDAAPALAEWVASILPAVDDSLARIGDGDWKPGTREIVLRHVSAEMIRMFAENDIAFGDTEQWLEREGARHLALYVIAQSRATVLRARP